MAQYLETMGWELSWNSYGFSVSVPYLLRTVRRASEERVALRLLEALRLWRLFSLAFTLLCKNICQKCQDSLMYWFTELIPDSFGWFLGFRKVRKSAGIYIVKHRFMHRKTLVYNGYLIGLWPLGEATSSVGRLILSKPKNQAKVSGFNIENQPISWVWFIWFIFFELIQRVN